MADAPPPPSSPERSPTAPPPPASQHYWCYQCDKRVQVDAEDGIVCRECRNGFVEAMAASAAAAAEVEDFVVDDPEFGSQFLQVLRLIAQASREDGAGEGGGGGDVARSLDLDRVVDEDFLRIELDGWHNDEEEEEDEDEDDDDEFEEEEDEEGEEEEVGDGDVVEEEEEDDEEDDVYDEEFEDGEEEEGGDEVSDNNNDENNGVVVGGGDNANGNEEGEDVVRRRRSDVLRLRIRDMASRATSGRNRFLDWAEILMGLENNSIELRVELPETDDYFANPEDYVDAAGYEALLQNLADSDQSGRRGAPAAAKTAVAELPTVVIAVGEEVEACAICKDGVSAGDSVKQLPCGHGYHEDCIVPWLGSRNSCPVCRYELPTDDPEYEEERKKKLGTTASGASGSGVL